MKNQVSQHMKKVGFHCDNFKKNFGARRAYNKHMKVQHGQKLNLPCTFCKKFFHERGNLQQHQTICAQIPVQVVLSGYVIVCNHTIIVSNCMDISVYLCLDVYHAVQCYTMTYYAIYVLVLISVR